MSDSSRSVRKTTARIATIGGVAAAGALLFAGPSAASPIHQPSHHPVQQPTHRPAPQPAEAAATNGHVSRIQSNSSPGLGW